MQRHDERGVATARGAGSGQPRGARRSGTARWVAALVTGILAASAACGALAVPSPRIPSANAGIVPFGVYAGPGEPKGVAYFALHTGTMPSLASDYLPRTEGWAGMVDVRPLRRFLSPWQSTQYRLVLGVPMLPTRNGNAGGDDGGRRRRALRRRVRHAARTLVHYGEGNAILRLGWEFNGTWYPWSVTDQTAAANFAAFFRNIVTTMRIVPGAAFRFVWNPTAGPEPEPAENAYPGDAYVDYVGLDLYDQVWGIPQDPGLAWPRYVTEPNGLRWLSSFATAHHKPAVIPEWGVTIRSDGHGLGDDPLLRGQDGAVGLDPRRRLHELLRRGRPRRGARPLGPGLLPVPGGLRAVLRRRPGPASFPPRTGPPRPAAGGPGPWWAWV